MTRQALNYASWMLHSGEYEGCDWCCGGGDQLMDQLMSSVRKSRGKGVSLPERCEICNYYDARNGSSLCVKCRKAEDG